jgi:hypothetical protein
MTVTCPNLKYLSTIEIISRRAVRNAGHAFSFALHGSGIGDLVEVFTRSDRDGIEEDPVRTEDSFEAFVDATRRPCTVVTAVAHEYVGHDDPS